MQDERRKNGKPLIKSWDRMMAKRKGKFLEKDYHLSLYRYVHILKQRLLTITEYIEEFYMVNLRVSYVQDTLEKTKKYINGLKLGIQDEINMLSPRMMEEAYQFALNAEEKIMRKQNSSRGHGFRGKG